MSPTLRVSHAARYARLGALLLKHLDVRPADVDLGGTSDDAAEGTAEDAAGLADELHSLGPTYVKLGQLLSTRSDLLPEPYLEALGRLRDKVPPMEPGEAERVLAQELNIRVSSAFQSFVAKPLGSASLGQVHKAILRDGRPVAVKVQRVGVRDQVLDDISVIAELASFLDEHSDTAKRFGLGAMVSRFRDSLLSELDYRQEASHLRVVRSQLEEYHNLVIPRPVDDFCTSRVLTMDYIAGRSVGALGPLTLMETDHSELAEELFRSYLDQVLVHGIFHSDPHPGNVLLTDDGKLALVDFGQVGRLAPDTQELLLRLFLAVSDGNGPEAAKAMEALGEPLDDFDVSAFRAAVGELVLRLHGSTVSDVQTGRILGELSRAAVRTGLRPPAELVLVGKAMLNLDEIARRIGPNFVPDEAVRSHAASLMRHHMLEATSPARLLTGALDTMQFAEQLPARLNKVLESLADGNFTLNVEGVDEAELMRSVQKLANRAATGVVIASLVLAAAIFSVSKAGPKAAGYPVVTLVLLGLAILAAVWMLAGIVRSDLPQHPKAKRHRV